MAVQEAAAAAVPAAAAAASSWRRSSLWREMGWVAQHEAKLLLVGGLRREGTTGQQSAAVCEAIDRSQRDTVAVIRSDLEKPPHGLLDRAIPHTPR